MISNTKTINYLPLNILSRYELFLVLFGKKHSAAIEIKDDKKNFHSKVQNFLNKHKIFFSIDRENPTLYFVSKTEESIIELQKIWKVEGESVEIKKGLLLGYPKEAVIAYAKYAKSLERSKYLSLCVEPYGGYMIRTDRKTEDSKTSLQWRNFVEKENPKLVEWLDNKINPLLKTLSSQE